MSFTLQPSPEGYLEQIRRQQNRRGLLRIFLGYAAGTGKTYAMLGSARSLYDEGRDVLIGLVETHGRAGTAQAVGGLPELPRKKVEHNGRLWEEFDLEAALERRPEILLLDELAHTNVGEGRHQKRWGDVLELLDAGIEVHTTLNVQHLESVAEVVTDITGVTIRELVPDKVLEEAEEIVLIDLPPDVLLERLDAGKIYRSDQVSRAREGFFQKTHLLALRELAMRKATHHVDEDARDYLRQQSLAGPWTAGERLLVCVGPSPTSERLVRATKRLADGLSATWVALHIDTGHLSPAEHERVDSHLQLAQRLGAEVISQTSHSLVDQVLETVAAKNVTRVVTGRTPHNSSLMAGLRPSLADAVLRRARGVDVLVLSSGDELPNVSSKVPEVGAEPTGYLGAVVLVSAATLLGLPMTQLVNPAIQMMLYLAAVVGVAYRFGTGPSNFASVLSVVCLNFFFVSPRFTLFIDQPSYWLSFFGLLLNGLLVSRLTGSVKAQSRSAQLREADALTLLAVSRDLAGAETQESLAQVASTHLDRAFGSGVVVLADSEGRLIADGLSDRDKAVADQAYRTGQATGKGTETLSGASHQWHPLRGPTKVLGVVGLESPVALGARRREDLLEAILNQVSAAIERRLLAESAQAAELLKASERLQTALLNSVSHDLRIPLVSIQGALTSLQDSSIVSDTGRRGALVENALSETDRLNRLVGNLLQKTRLDAGHLTLKKLPCDVEDLISTTVSSLTYRWEEREVEIEIEPDLPLVPMDFVLIAQVLTNLIENALAYSAGGTPIGIRAVRDGESLHVEVLDRGVGLDGVDVERLFERFERGKTKNPSGIGLGLSICRGLVEAHGGQVTARPRDGGGAIFSFNLPMENKDEE